MHAYCRITKITNAVGRADYISNEKRQEDIVAKSKDEVDWKELHQFEHENRRSMVQNNDARELIIALPNEWGGGRVEEIEKRCDELAEELIPDGYEKQWAVHWNQSHTNLHMHLMFAERQRLEYDCRRWDRDIWIDANGKVARRSADRVTLLHKKGSPKDKLYDVKNPRFKTKSWLRETRDKVKEFLASYMIRIDDPNPLHQIHVGKGKDAPRREMANDIIRAANEEIRMKHLYGATAAEINHLKQIALTTAKKCLQGKIKTPTGKIVQKVTKRRVRSRGEREL